MATLTSYEYARELLKNCGVETKLAELMGLLRRLVDEYAYGNISDEELQGYVAKICQGITFMASRCGRPIALDTCINELTTRIKNDSLAGAGLSLLDAFMERLRKRRTSTTTHGTSGILG